MLWIANILANQWTVAFLVGTLIVIAVIFTIIYRNGVKSAKLPLKAAIAILQGTKDRREFSSNYQHINSLINTAFSPHPQLVQQWQRFQSQITTMEDFSRASYRQPEEFFSSNAILKSQWIMLSKAGPNYLVGMGLVFTFLGIAVVVYRASLALGSDNDLEEIRKLLGAASLKFWTSLVGVFLSIVCSAYFRHLAARFNINGLEFLLRAFNTNHSIES